MNPDPAPALTSIMLSGQTRTVDGYECRVCRLPITPEQP
jgi:hypothetical protein